MNIVVCTNEQLNDKTGLHLNQPDLFYLRTTIKDALDKNFDTIYLHFERKGTANLLISYDVLEFLTRLPSQVYHNENMSFKLKFIHPCTSDNSPQIERDLK